LYTKCTACAAPFSPDNKRKQHPTLQVPICGDCTFHINEGEFTILEGNEIYCRMCGQGEGDLLLCDTCPKSFCERCITNSAGISELRHIQSIAGRWSCFLCASQPIQDLCSKMGWPYILDKKRTFNRKGMVCQDVSRGRERYEIPVFNTVDDAPAPLDFTYVNRFVAGKDVTLSNNPNEVACCTCTDNCQDPERCECARMMDSSFAYDNKGILIREKMGGVFECNARCHCNASRCKNRVVGNGPTLKLEVFRCADPTKGWGVRCRDDIQINTFICDYLGEVLTESNAENRGLVLSDEYLYNSDFYGMCNACTALSELGMKRPVRKQAKESDVDSTAVTAEDAAELLDDEELMALLNKAGTIDRALSLGQRLREDPTQTVADMEEGFNHRGGKKPPVVVKKRDRSAAGTAAKALALKAEKVEKVKGENGNGKGKGKAAARAEAEEALEAKKNDKEAAARALAEVAADRKRKLEDPKLIQGKYSSFYDFHSDVRQKQLGHASSLVQDKAITKTENEDVTYTLDARWYGNVARFLNHKCEPNLDKKIVFSDSQDYRLPRIAFFSGEFIKAGTELSYDYGYLEGNVQGKGRDCLCGSDECRRVLY